MDHYDRRLLELMQSDATLSVGELAEKIALSKTACWRRVRKLEKQGVIRDRVTLLEPAAVNLGLTVYIVVRTNQHNDAWAKRFSEVVADIPGVLEAYRMSGDVDYLLRAVVSDLDGYDRLYKELIRADLFDVSSSFVMETLKWTTALPLENAST
ncbi:MAG: Lrp/AsnC family transcriptional regulator [Gammaproteobacteria bacterium]|jgi:Lrp/AsnC family transcriptional regulator|nr:Lrp/AsnC family transcriptional regulator [Gammaproteobacteria bacterium]